MLSPQIKRQNRKEIKVEQANVGIKSSADLRKFKLNNRIIRKSISMEEIPLFNKEEEDLIMTEKEDINNLMDDN